MPIELLHETHPPIDAPTGEAMRRFSVSEGVRRVLRPLASLRLTVVLLATAMFIVLAGTLAQVEKDIWQVTDEYFRTATAWIDIQIFFPRHWFPNLPELPGRFPFPGGWLIGFVMALNLLTAHLTRFKVQVRGRRLAAGAVLVTLGALMTWLVIASGSNQNDMGETGEIQWSSLRILWQLMKGGLASLILLGGCAVVFKKRAGIVLLHAGVGLMMLGELLVGTQAVEGHMRIEEGQTANFVEETRFRELAIVDHADPKEDHVVVIPGSMLQKSSKLQHEALPFDVTVIQFFTNSKIRQITSGESNLATAGMGLHWIAEEEAPASGTGDEINLPSAYVHFTKKASSESLGTYLVGLLASQNGMSENVAVDGTHYSVSLRNRRVYKPYTLQLIDFRFDKYLGTTKAKNFSSDVRLTDPTRGVDRKAKIWMNNPLRYAGETLYQSGHGTNQETGAEITILQVVSNWGWMIPYVSCMMVATGLLAHFSIVLLRFLQQRSTHDRDEKQAGNISQANGSRARMSELALPTIVVACAALLLFSMVKLSGQSQQEMQLYEFGKLPVAYEGRVKPLDTLARNSLSIISQKQTFRDAAGTAQPAIRWLLDVITASEQARQYKIFRIENPDILQTLGLPRRKGYRYGLDEFNRHTTEFHKQVASARSRKKELLSVYEKKSIELDNKLQAFRMLQESFRPALIREGHEKEDLFASMERVEKLETFEPPLAVPTGNRGEDTWMSFASAWNVAHGRRLLGEEPNAASVSMINILGSYACGDAGTFNREVAKYQGALKSNPPEQFNWKKIQFEAFFNHCQPFLWSTFLYLLAFVLASLAWLGWSAPLNRAAFWMIVFTLLVHTTALISRIYISGRPPVTNLYSSAVFVGWGCVVLGLILELIHRLGIGNILAAVSGFATLLVAHFLSRQGDTFVVLQAVLDTQFWLATHVVCITLGYATTFAAGCLGILYIIRGACTPWVLPKVGQELSRMIYGTVCFAVFFTFVGTVLGGLWADDSWGRFWGWDPKENGALMIVLWNALVLHARWGGMVKQRGLAVLAVGGNICTAWSWFGTNELGVGLHSYGFTEGVLLALGIFCLSQLVVIAIGLVPNATGGRNQTVPFRND